MELPKSKLNIIYMLEIRVRNNPSPIAWFLF